MSAFFGEALLKITLYALISMRAWNCLVQTSLAIAGNLIVLLKLCEAVSFDGAKKRFQLVPQSFMH